jgi:hypothetical protein
MKWAILIVAALMLGCDKTAKDDGKVHDSKPVGDWKKLLNDADADTRAKAILALHKAGDPAALASFNAMPPTKEKIALARDLGRPESERAPVVRAYLEDRKFQFPPEEASPAVLELCETDAGRQAVQSHLIPYFRARATEKESDTALWQNENPWQALLKQAEGLTNPQPG